MAVFLETCINWFSLFSYLRDSMLVPVLAIVLCLCLSVRSRCCIETAERIGLVFSMGALSHPSSTVLKGNSSTFKNKGTSLWNYARNSGLRKFRHSIQIVKVCYRLNQER